jgi:hypothetical protein
MMLGWGVQVCVEIVGYLLEELRDGSNYEQFQKDMADANIFIGSLIFIEELAEKVTKLCCLCCTPGPGKHKRNVLSLKHTLKGCGTCADRGDGAAGEGAARCLPGLPVNARRHVSYAVSMPPNITLVSLHALCSRQFAGHLLRPGV